MIHGDHLSDRVILLTGAGGQLASELEERLRDRSEVVPLSRSELDITDEGAVEHAFSRVQPDVVFNCAAFHNVEMCEHEVDRSFEVNARAVKQLAERCAEGGAQLVHLSTNYVFDGDRDEPYSERDLPGPCSIYAISKLAGEHAALAYCPSALVVRSSGLYGLHGGVSKGGNFVQRMLARAREQGALRVVADQYLTPTYTGDLAAALIEAIDRDLAGLLHLTSSGSCSWHQFTLAIMALAGIDTPVEAVATLRSPGSAHRPLNGVLACDRAVQAGVQALPPWRDALEDYMTRAGLAAIPAANH